MGQLIKKLIGTDPRGDPKCFKIKLLIEIQAPANELFQVAQFLIKTSPHAPDINLKPKL